MDALKAAKAAAVAVTLLVGLEAIAPRPYLDIAGVLTDCVGNTKNVRWDHIRSKQECMVLLNSEVGRRIQDILKDDKQGGMTVNQLAAFTSWHYNVSDIGPGTAYATSTLRRKIIAGDYIGACNEMPRWNKITVRGQKVPSKGLNNRRAKELSLCLKPE